MARKGNFVPFKVFQKTTAQHASRSVRHLFNKSELDGYGARPRRAAAAGRTRGGFGLSRLRAVQQHKFFTGLAAS
jgi:hypothetical protein